MKRTFAALLFLGWLPLAAQSPARFEPPDSLSQPAAGGSGIKYFAEIDQGVYKGSKPKSDADFRFLQSLHVKYIVDLQVLPFVTVFESRTAKKYGITVLRGTMNASPISPSEKHVDHILALLRDSDKHPIYFHCRYGRDRTGVIAALYQMYFEGMTESQAMQYLHDSGYAFKFGWIRSGLVRYLKNHPNPPAGVVAAASY